MKAEYNPPITIKIWFQGTSTSRNICNVVRMEESNGIMRIEHEDNNYFKIKTSIINMANVNLIEQL